MTTETPMTTADDAVPEGLIPSDIATSDIPVAVYGFARAKQGREGDLLKEILAIIEPVRREVGCRQYEVHTTAETPGVFVFYERWASGPDLLRHLQQPFMQTYFGRLPDLTDGDLEAHWIHPIKP